MRRHLGLPFKRSKLSVVQVRHAARVRSSARRAGAVSVLATYVMDTTIALTEPTRRAARAPQVQVGAVNGATSLPELSLSQSNSQYYPKPIIHISQLVATINQKAIPEVTVQEMTGHHSKPRFKPAH